MVILLFLEDSFVLMGCLEELVLRFCLGSPLTTLTLVSSSSSLAAKLAYGFDICGKI
jgi:hypothetical protein